jgi:hypothetical protein
LLVLEIVGAAVAARYLLPPSLFTKQPTPAFMLSVKDALKRHPKLILVVLSVIGLVALGTLGLSASQGFMKDSATVKRIEPTAQLVYKALDAADTRNERILAAQQAAGLADMTFSMKTDGFALCALFFTDQSWGASKKLLYEPKEASRHHKGYNCYKYPLTEQQAKRDTKVWTSLMVLALDASVSRMKARSACASRLKTIT